MTKNPKHYSNIDRIPHEGDRVRLHIAPGRFGEEFTVDGTALAQVGNGWPRQHELVTPWWDVDAEPDPTGGDPVVEARTQEGGTPSTLYRCTDGEWSRARGRGHGTWATDELLDVRRLQPTTIADLMHNTEHNTTEN